MQVIGAGGDAYVFVDPDEPSVVVKAIFKNNDTCTKAGIEYEKQRAIYQCFECLRDCETDDPLVALINQYVRVARPSRFEGGPTVINGVTYHCSIAMSRLHGLPLRLYEEFDPRIVERIDPDYRGELNQMMAHLAFNSDITGLFGVKQSMAKITRQNPPRGYFSKRETGFFQFLREKHGLPLSDDELEHMVGFIYGWIYFACAIIPLDVEMALGLNPESSLFELNVLDFGMAFDKNALEKNTSAFESRRFFSVYGDKTLTSEAREEELTQRVIEDTGLDLYASLDEGSESLQGFVVARNLNPCAQCKRLTCYVNQVSGLFLCSDACASLSSTLFKK